VQTAGAVGGDTFTYYVCDRMKYWTMGSELMSKIILDRKPWCQDEAGEETQERPARVPQPDLYRHGAGEERV
jgi:hypothetical protein